jgi:hypothetical protein
MKVRRGAYVTEVSEKDPTVTGLCTGFVLKFFPLVVSCEKGISKPRPGRPLDLVVGLRLRNDPQTFVGALPWMKSGRRLGEAPMFIRPGVQPISSASLRNHQ